jgi:hypothetical protein
VLAIDPKKKIFQRCILLTSYLSVALAQSELAQLFLLHDDEKREDVMPAFELSNLKDDPKQNSKRCGVGRALQLPLQIVHLRQKRQQ